MTSGRIAESWVTIYTASETSTVGKTATQDGEKMQRKGRQPPVALGLQAADGRERMSLSHGLLKMRNERLLVIISISESLFRHDMLGGVGEGSEDGLDLRFQVLGCVGHRNFRGHSLIIGQSSSCSCRMARAFSPPVMTPRASFIAGGMPSSGFRGFDG